LGVFAAFSVPSIQPDHLTPVLGDHGVSGTLAGAAVFFWSWDGFVRPAIMASEIKDPRRNIPFAIVGGIAFAAVVFVVVGTTALGVLGAAATAQHDTPIFDAARQAIGMGGGWVVLAAGCVRTLP